MKLEGGDVKLEGGDVKLKGGDVDEGRGVGVGWRRGRLHWELSQESLVIFITRSCVIMRALNN